jgi:hypothetical protein
MSEANERVTSESNASLCSAVGGDIAAIEADVQRMADILAQWKPQVQAWLDEADAIMDKQERDGCIHSCSSLSWLAFHNLRTELEEAVNANQRMMRAVMDGKRAAIR